MEEVSQKEEKQEAGEIVVKNKFFTWLENYWYHYKWQTLVVVFFLIIGLVCFVQCGKENNEDLSITYIGNVTLDGSQQEEIEKVFSSLLDDKTIGFHSFSAYNEQELTAMCTDGEKFDNLTYSTLKNTNSNNFSTFTTQYMAGQTAIFFVSPYVTTEVNVKDLAVTIDTLFETAPASKVNTYALKLGDLAIYKYYKALQVLPADTLIVFRAAGVIGDLTDEKLYSEYKDLYYKIVNFSK